jgi:hypothetical protein
MNSEAKVSHTPGPWSVSTVHFKNADGGWPSFVVKGPDGKSVCNCTSNSTRPGLEIKANGYLVNAAPRMLHALKLAEKFLSANYTEADMPDILPWVRKAIAEAGGES